MNKRITLYQRLKPKAKETLRGNAVKYELSTNEIVKLLESTQFYSDLTIDQVKNIIVFSGTEPKSISDLTHGDFLFESNLNEAP